MDPQQNSFGAFLKDRRLAAGATQRSLAIKLDVTRQQMSDLEAGKCLPSTELAEGIASELQLSNADRDLMRDVIARDKEVVPTDLGGYMMDTTLQGLLCVGLAIPNFLPRAGRELSR